ncbi:hypothetical protein D3C76_474490 [compost metagenome]
MAGAVLNERDQVGIVGDSGRALRCQFFEQGADATDYIDVLLFIVAADIVGLTDRPFGGDLEQCASMVLDIQPVANL